MPDRVVIKDSEDLKTKINERIQNVESGKVKMLTIDGAFEKKRDNSESVDNTAMRRISKKQTLKILIF